jgi:nicotinamide-nucleotide amidase
MLPSGAVPITNLNGTAPGVWMEYEDKLVLLLPGPSGELKPMLAHILEKALTPRLHLVKRPAALLKIHTCGIGESALAELLGPILTDPPAGIRMAILAHVGQVTVQAESTSDNPDLSATLLQEIKARVLERVEKHVYGYGEDTIQMVCHQLLLEQGLSLAVAESCSGGWLAKCITDIPGSSAYFWGGLCTYDNEAKQKVLSVQAGRLEQFGAVSAEVAHDMADGLKKLSGVDITISITGIAGPGGGSELKPVGTVYVSLMRADIFEVQRFVMAGSREMVRRRTVAAAFNMLWKSLKLSV